MKRTAYRRRDPALPKVERIALDDAGVRRRAILTIALILVALAAFGYAIWRLLPEADGWKEIEVQSSAAANCGGEFTLMYELGTGDAAPTLEYKQVSARYSEAAVEAYRLFHCRESFEGVNNLATLNAHPNETVALDAALYAALETLAASGSRVPYLAPVYETYQGLFNSVDDAEAAQYDPRSDAALAAQLAALAAYARDPAAVELELLGEGRARLRVGEAYLRTAAENGVTAYFDLFWLQNAFIADYLADALTAAGHTAGILTSYDGYTRALGGEGYAAKLYDLAQGRAYEAGRLACAAPMSLAQLRAFPLGGLDTVRYYTWSDGRVSVPFIDPADGLDRAAAACVTAYSKSASCAELALALAEIMTADALDEDALLALPARGIDAIWTQNGALRQTDPQAAITQNGAG